MNEQIEKLLSQLWKNKQLFYDFDKEKKCWMMSFPEHIAFELFEKIYNLNPITQSVEKD